MVELRRQAGSRWVDRIGCATVGYLLPDLCVLVADFVVELLLLVGGCDDESEKQTSSNQRSRVDMWDGFEMTQVLPLSHRYWLWPQIFVDHLGQLGMLNIFNGEKYNTKTKGWDLLNSSFINNVADNADAFQCVSDPITGHLYIIREHWSSPNWHMIIRHDFAQDTNCLLSTPPTYICLRIRPVFDTVRNRIWCASRHPHGLIYYDIALNRWTNYGGGHPPTFIDDREHFWSRLLLINQTLYVVGSGHKDIGNNVDRIDIFAKEPTWSTFDIDLVPVEISPNFKPESHRKALATLCQKKKKGQWSQSCPIIGVYDGCIIYPSRPTTIHLPGMQWPEKFSFINRWDPRTNICHAFTSILSSRMHFTAVTV